MPIPFVLNVSAALQAKLKSDAHSIFQKTGKDIFLAAAPGRLDILGGLASSTGSLACALPLPLGSAVAVQRREDRKLILSTYNSIGGGGQQPSRIEMSLDDFYGTGAMMPLETIHALFAQDRSWAAHLAGAFWTLGKHRKLTRRATGANIACFSDLPLASGLGSSAALQVAGLIALTAAYHLILDPLEIAIFAHSIEHQIVNLPTSPAEPLASALGHPGQLILPLSQPHSIESYLVLPQTILIAALTPSPTPHSPDPTPHIHAVTAAAMAQTLVTRAFKDLGLRSDPTKGYLVNLNPHLYRNYLRPILPRRLSGRDFLALCPGSLDRTVPINPHTLYTPRAAADHHVFENSRVRAFIAALQQPGTPSLLRAGRLLYASHASLTNRAHLPTTPADQLVRTIASLGPTHGLYGARASGHSAGSVAILAANTPAALSTLQSLATQCPNSQLLLSSPAPLTSSAAESAPLKIPAAQLLP